MASHTQITKKKRRQNKSKQGRKRKNSQSKKSTLNAVEFFACLDTTDKK